MISPDKNVYWLSVAGVVVGLLLVVSIESNLIATEVAISIAFIINLLILNSKKIAEYKSRLQNITASLLLGTLIGVLLT